MSKKYLVRLEPTGKFFFGGDIVCLAHFVAQPFVKKFLKHKSGLWNLDADYKRL